MFLSYTLWADKLAFRTVEKETERLDSHNYNSMWGVTEWLSSGKLDSVYLWVLPREEHDTGFQLSPSSTVWLG